MLLLTASRPVSLVVSTCLEPNIRFLLLLHSFGLVDVGRPLWWDNGSVIYIRWWPSPAQLNLPPMKYTCQFASWVWIQLLWWQLFGVLIGSVDHCLDLLKCRCYVYGLIAWRRTDCIMSFAVCCWLCFFQSEEAVLSNWWWPRLLLLLHSITAKGRSGAVWLDENTLPSYPLALSATSPF